MRPPRFCYRAFEFRAEHPGGGDGRTLEGYAAVFDQPAHIDSWEGNFYEQIARGAFKRTLNARKPVLQFDHGQDVRTGSVPIGAIREIHEDDHGLFVRAELFDNDLVLPIRQAIAGGAIDGMSFRFRVVDDRWTERDDGTRLRTIREVELFELGPVVFPAYQGTSVGVRSMLAHLPEGERVALIRELAAELRALDAAEPARQGTSPAPTEPARQGTSGLSHDRRAALLRGLSLESIR